MTSKEKKITNYERIMSMSKEDLAEEIRLIAKFGSSAGSYIAIKDKNFFINWLDSESDK